MATNFDSNIALIPREDGKIISFEDGSLYDAYATGKTVDFEKKDNVKLINTDIVIKDDTFKKRHVSYTAESESEIKLFHLIVSDFVENVFTYFLIAVFVALCLFKVHQVQETRSITAMYNQVSIDNDNLHKKWLTLMSEKQMLSEHAKIRVKAVEKLGMVSPKTDLEYVINLHK